MESREANAVRIRHTGVLGLCAFISAYPYDVPDFVPNVFEHLGAHLNDPQPIPVSLPYLSDFNTFFFKICFFFNEFYSQPFEKQWVTLSVLITITGKHTNSNLLKISWQS